MNQAQIEKYAGINIAIASYVMTVKTPKTKNVINQLRLAVNFPENCSLALLEEAVRECREEMIKSGRSVE